MQHIKVMSVGKSSVFFSLSGFPFWAKKANIIY